jgi:biotin carboxyl carrier protein
MKYYTITVNGNTYEVSVEENNSPVHTAAPAPALQVKQQDVPVKQAAQVQAAPVQATAAAPSSNTLVSVKVNSPMPGKILALKTNPGQTVKKGEVVLILEAMKMENEIVSPQDGSIASINVTAGQSVEAGDLLFTLN